jgi:RHH-type proline utilization regulon transcriptional repressor/proline dehydrogenase/delta 1-pyrroline-5-carboxylate dehydrogenase
MFATLSRHPLLPQLLEISRQAFTDETAAVEALLLHTEKFAPKQPAIEKHALAIIQAVRSKKAGFGVESFLNEYGLSSKEGVTIMCLAEALLRIPDSATADALIHDKFSGAEWENHLGHSPSLFVNASTWGLLLTGKVINLDHHQRSLGKLVSGIVTKAGEPIIRSALKKAMKILGTEFVLGETIASALQNSVAYARKNYLFSYDVLGEGARSASQASHYYEGYKQAITAIGQAADPTLPFSRRPSISIKLSALHPRYELFKYERMQQELLPKLKELCQMAMGQHISVTLDAEEASRLDLSLLLFTELLSDPQFEGYNGIGIAVQAYQKRALPVLELLQKLAKTHNKRIPVRLVKGAYWDSEIKKAQSLGLEGYPVFTRKPYTDVSYLACAMKLLAHPQQFYPQFATHNALTVASIIELAGDKDYEFQRLHGMGEALYDHLLASEQIQCRIYAPVGAHTDLLSYLIRRLLENGANSSFVHLFADKDTPVRRLIADPIATTRGYRCTPSPTIPLPSELYGKERANPQAVDYGNLQQVVTLHERLSDYRYNTPLHESLPEAYETALQHTHAAYSAWSRTSLAHRAEVLQKIADHFEAHRDQLIALCMQEGKKTVADAVGELREAIDYCRYYATTALKVLAPHSLRGVTGETNELSLHGRGVFFCISPWNFPLAIFTGQITAALVAGNSVIAKPAEQTPRIAQLAVELMHRAGVPADVLMLLIGDGAEIGSHIIPDPRIAGVVFTGSTQTATLINRQLASRNGPIIPLIAETGGQNCMIVDSSALLEHAVDDILASAFGSAGQRCSALRVLYVQEEIAAPLIALLKEAMQEMTVGDPLDFSTDLGPVIDSEAFGMLSRHEAVMEKNATIISTAAPDSGRCLFPPLACEIRNIAQLPEEIFGPVLHIIRYKSSALDDVIDAINSSGYGLTFGVHSRIEEKIYHLRNRIEAGNFYVNRTMIGAVVGVQPFGGEGLSGTGPKAGGPHYLLRFCKERTFTVNTTTVGGNLELYR